MVESFFYLLKLQLMFQLVFVHAFVAFYATHIQIGLLYRHCSDSKRLCLVENRSGA